jgi:outer membrane protein assembly factor BamB
MKLQCPCGAKYAFDLTPEMVQNPVKFVCPTCGLDSSEFVNEMVRREFGVAAPVETGALPHTPPPPPPVSRLRISREEKPAEPPPEAAPVSKYCPKHRGVLATDKCSVCHKPICPQCMEQFGFFCSPLCKNKADLQGLAVPVYAGQKFEKDRRFWRKAGLIFGSLATVLAVLLGFWGWYVFYGSRPHILYSVRFADEDRAYAGAARLVGKDQVVVLHGGTLVRYDLKTKKPVWSQELISADEIAAAVKTENDATARAVQEGDDMVHRQTQEDIEREAKIWFQEKLQLRVAGQNIWVGKGNRVTQYDWDTGKVLHEISLPVFGGSLVEHGDELLMLGAQSVTHINLATGEFSAEDFPVPGATEVASAGGPGNASSGGGLLSNNGKPLDPNAVAAQAQNLTLPARIALPALLGNAAHEQQLEAALRDDPQHPRPQNTPASRVGLTSLLLVPGPDGFAQFASTLLEEKLVTRSAVKAPPKKPALDGNANVAQTTEIANELLNEMQRNNGGDTVTQDESTFQVVVHLPDSPGTPDWTGVVTGPPQLFVLKTVNVIAAGQTLIVLDKANKQLWTASLLYAIPAGHGSAGGESKYGAGPCVEHGDTLYVFDQAMLSAFELGTGNARWRLPSVGVVGLFFDPQDFIYVNTTSGNPDDIKYSRQIDIGKATDDILTKLDPKNGKTLWSIKPGGFISYLSGKFIYAVQSYDPNPLDAETVNDMALQKPAYLRIIRINPQNGRLYWEYYDDSCPVNIRFDENSIELVYKREVDVLRYLVL